MDIPFSDHEAVMATLHIWRQGQAAATSLGTAGKVGGVDTDGVPHMLGGLVDGLVELDGVFGDVSSWL